MNSKADAERQALAEKEKGNAAYRQKNFVDALRHYNNAIELDPDNMVFYTNRTAVLFEQGKFVECVDFCDQAISLGHRIGAEKKQIAKAYTRGGNAFLRIGSVAKALNWYKKSIAEYFDADLAKKIDGIEKDLAASNKPEKKATPSPLPELPVLVWEQVLMNVPRKDLFNCRLVSRTFNKLIDKPKLHPRCKCQFYIGMLTDERCAQVVLSIVYKKTIIRDVLKAWSNGRSFRPPPHQFLRVFPSDAPSISEFVRTEIERLPIEKLLLKLNVDIISIDDALLSRHGGKRNKFPGTLLGVMEEVQKGFEANAPKIRIEDARIAVDDPSAFLPFIEMSNKLGCRHFDVLERNSTKNPGWVCTSNISSLCWNFDSARVMRKADLLKMFKAWYDGKIKIGYMYVVVILDHPITLADLQLFVPTITAVPKYRQRLMRQDGQAIFLNWQPHDLRLIDFSKGSRNDECGFQEFCQETM